MRNKRLTGTLLLALVVARGQHRFALANALLSEQSARIVRPT
jgi:hypothetical protein